MKPIIRQKSSMDQLCSRSDLWRLVLCAPNVQLAHNHVQLQTSSVVFEAGDELAFLPPVTGG